jgi:hypothetical protein
MTPTSGIEVLRQEGLATGMENPVLTPRGRERLRLLEDLENEEIARTAEATDFVLSTNALVR